MELLDPEGYKQSKSCYEEAVKEQELADERGLVEESNYQGYRFPMKELRSFLGGIYGDSANIALIRFDPLIANCEVLF